MKDQVLTELDLEKIHNNYLKLLREDLFIDKTLLMRLTEEAVLKKVRR